MNYLTAAWKLCCGGLPLPRVTFRKISKNFYRKGGAFRTLAKTPAGPWITPDSAAVDKGFRVNVTNQLDFRVLWISTDWQERVSYWRTTLCALECSRPGNASKSFLSYGSWWSIWKNANGDTKLKQHPHPHTKSNFSDYTPCEARCWSLPASG